MTQFVGRQQEKKILLERFQSPKSEFVAIYGRRRVGKTYLVRHTFDNNFHFHVTGLYSASLEQQLLNFHLALQKKVKAELTIPKNWFVAFQQLIQYLEDLPSDEKKVIFLDELPWFDSPKSGFFPALEHFWNHWASGRSDIMMIVCGSAASWILNKLIHNKGGLHNRVTQQIKVEVFTLAETEAFLQLKNCLFDRYQIVQLYMALGGIPYYLDFIKAGFSAAQNIDLLCFSETAPLKSEFDNLYTSIFSHVEKHELIIEALATKNKGLNRNELLTLTKQNDGGSFTRVCKELEESGFIRVYKPYGNKKRNSLYQLTDLFSLFSLKFLKSQKSDTKFWINSHDSSTVRAWSGYAYEMVCLLHLSQIKKALGISGIQTITSSWISAASQNGAQIDLVIDRKDNVITILEVKFSIAPFSIDKGYAMQLLNKVAAFKEESKTKKAVYLAMITTYGLNSSPHIGLVQNSLTMDDLFLSGN